MHRIVLSTALLLASVGAAAAAAPVTPTAGVIADYERYGADARKGLPGMDSGVTLPDVRPAAANREAAALRGFRDRLLALRRQRLSDEDRLNADLLLHVIDERLGVIRFDEARMPFNSDGGFDSDLVYAADRAKIRNARDLAGWLRLLAAVPHYYADNIANARRGIATGFVQPRITVERVLERARLQAAMPIDQDPLLQPVVAATGLSQQAREEALAQAKSLIGGDIRNARNGFVSFLTTDYLPHARKNLAVTSLPGGKAYYAWLVERYTTTNLPPEQIHAMGESEVARIHGEMEATMRAAGFTGDLKAFIAFLRKDPRFYATSRQQMLEKGSEIAKRIDGQLPAHFGTLPRLTYGIREVPRAIEDGYTTGRYFEGDPVRGVAGGLMLNTSHLDQRPLYELPALELHEGVPGHHIQIALAQEMKNVPEFRRELYFSGFGEGWGLYSEWLGQEMGIYRDPYEQFGRQSYEMWRACRLVADTGIHLLGWSLDQAKSCFRQNTALSELNIDVEVQRYVSWPGQALAYKIGEITIRQLRSEAERRLGDDFDERKFHDAVLLQGALPLDLLKDQVHRWIEQRLASSRSRSGLRPDAAASRN